MARRHGNAPLTRTLGIRDGVATVAAGARGRDRLPGGGDAAGKRVVPGFIDVHTHYDAEVLLDPVCGIRRHGVDNFHVLLGNCCCRRSTPAPRMPTCSAVLEAVPGYPVGQPDVVDARGSTSKGLTPRPVNVFTAAIRIRDRGTGP